MKIKGMIKLTLILFGLSAVGLVSFLVWFKVQTRPVDPSSTRIISVEVSPGQTLDQIGQTLVKEGLIRSVWVFRIQTALLGVSKALQAGQFDLSPRQNLREIVMTLTKGRSDQRVTILEGWRREQAAQALVALRQDPDSAFDPDEFLRLTQGKEGMLFPDTYSFSRSTTAKAAVGKLLANFQTKTKDLVNQSGLSDQEALVLASLVERESRLDSERPTIAGVLINRLRAGWPLQVDATLQYAKATAGCHDLLCDWWKNDLTRSDLELVSPYNTYRQPGLPPTPICNPSLGSLKAAYQPQKTDYWFYLHDAQGQVHFARTIEEHNRNVAKFLGK